MQRPAASPIESGDGPAAKRDFFVSFNQADRGMATWIAWVLEEAGYTVWFQDWDFKGNFVLEMDKATQQSRRTLAVLSPDYLTSRFTAPEWAACFAEDPTGEHDLLVPVRVRDCAPQGLLRPIVYLDLIGLLPEEAKARLLDRVSKIRWKPGEAPPFPDGAVPKEERVVPDRPMFPLPPNLPQPNRLFIGRTDELAAVAQALTASGKGGFTQPVAITGMGGIGKTQLALAFAYAHLGDYDLIRWLRAEEPTALAADYAGMAPALGLGPDTPDQAALIAAIRAKLEGQERWLLVFDNATRPEALEDFLPRTGTGHVLITSRWQDWEGTAEALKLAVLPEAEAVALLLGDDAGDDPAQHVAAAELAGELGRLPLALAQARAFIRARQVGVAGYQQQLATARPKVLAWRPPNASYPLALAQAWQASVDHAARDCPAARELMQLLVFFAPDAIPRDLLGADPEALSEELRDLFDRDSAIEALGRFSLVRVEPATLTVHRLVQAVTADRLDEATAKVRVETAVRLANAALPLRPWEPIHWQTISALLSHTLSAAAEAERLKVGSEEAGFALLKAGMYLAGRASYGEAEQLYRRAADLFENNPGPRHEIGLGLSLSVHANLCREIGRYAEAEPLYERSIELGKQVLGPEHPELAKRLENLAILYRDARPPRYAKAEPLLKRATAIFEKSLNKLEQLKPAPDPDVLRLATTDLAGALGNLGRLYFDKHQFAKAEPLYKRSIELDEKVLGREHPSLATRLNNLAELHRRTHRPTEAEELYRRAVANVEKEVLGPEHPNLIAPLHNLAELYRETGRPAEAEPLFERAIAIIEKTLPANHPHQVQVRKDYALLLDVLGRREEAAKLSVQVASASP